MSDSAAISDKGMKKSHSRHICTGDEYRYNEAHPLRGGSSPLSRASTERLKELWVQYAKAGQYRLFMATDRELRSRGFNVEKWAAQEKKP